MDLCKLPALLQDCEQAEYVLLLSRAIAHEKD